MSVVDAMTEWPLQLKALRLKGKPRYSIHPDDHYDFYAPEAVLYRTIPYCLTVLATAQAPAGVLEALLGCGCIMRSPLWTLIYNTFSAQEPPSSSGDAAHPVVVSALYVVIHNTNLAEKPQSSSGDAAHPVVVQAHPEQSTTSFRL